MIVTERESSVRVPIKSLKKSSTKLLSRFSQEMTILEELNHPKIICFKKGYRIMFRGESSSIILQNMPPMT